MKCPTCLEIVHASWCPELRKTSAASACYPASAEELMRRQRQYLEEIQPFVEMQANIMNMQPVRYVKQGNDWLREILWQPGSRETCDMLSQCIQNTARRIFQSG